MDDGLPQRPLLIEGEAGVGKTEVAKALAAVHGCELIRLQCYEGLDAARRALRMELSAPVAGDQGARGRRRERRRRSKRRSFPKTICSSGRCSPRSGAKTPPVLLIDEVDRADEEFEAFLLETVVRLPGHDPRIRHDHGASIPRVVLTSNATRELSDALRRRCLYHYLDFPDVDREAAHPA